MNLLKFWFLRTIHPTTNKQPKSKYASYIFFRKRQDVILCISVVKKVWQEGSAAAYFGLPFSKFSLHISRVRKAFAAREKSWQILVSYQNGMFVNLLLWRGSSKGEVLNESYEQIEQAAQDSRKVLLGMLWSHCFKIWMKCASEKWDNIEINRDKEKLNEI